MKSTVYSRFFLMLSASFILMYTVMYLNVEKLDHIHINATRLYMTLLMVTPMALVMLFFMRHMYRNRNKNLSIVVGSISIFILSILLLRTQTAISDVQYIKAMIPHHSSAILTSEEANISDPEVKKLAAKIIQSQKEEIQEMKKFLKRLQKDKNH